MITITIDDKTFETTPVATVLEVALANNINIPRLCYHKDLLPSGGCRLCIVEVEGRPNPTPQPAAWLRAAGNAALPPHRRYWP